jgi:hypothetical protein
VACKPEEVVNPYTEIEEVIEVQLPADVLPIDNFAWLHAKIFKPTCANSGCHDGTFEPHFNTISSSYNTLVNHPVIANDAQFSFDYRVVPGNVSASLLYERLTNEIENTSGMMPLVVDADSDWDAQRDNYLAALSAWINAGAPDMFGNVPGSGSVDFPPTIEGLLVFPAGTTSTPFERDPESVGVSPILVPPSTVDIWVAVTDDNTPPQNMAVNELQVATTLELLPTAAPLSFVSGASITAPGFTAGSLTYWHKASVNLSAYPAGTTLFLRTTFDDGAQAQPTQLPNTGSNAVITALFTLQIL